jgi:hypothetical protein
MVGNGVHDIQPQQAGIGTEFDACSAAKHIQRPDRSVLTDVDGAGPEKHDTMADAGIIVDRKVAAIQEGNPDANATADSEAEEHPQNRSLENSRQQCNRRKGSQPHQG